MEATYASKGVAGTGLGFGIAGTALALLQGGGLGGLFGGWGCNGGTAVAGGMGLAALAEKDAKIAQLSAELETDRKLVQVWDNLNTKREATDLKVAILEAKCETMQYLLGSITKESYRIRPSAPAGVLLPLLLLMEQALEQALQTVLLRHLQSNVD